MFAAGYSFGGTLAYEMASELKRNNETVAMVFMVDTYGWHPKALTYSSEFMEKSTDYNLKLTEKYVVRCKHPVAYIARNNWGHSFSFIRAVYYWFFLKSIAGFIRGEDE